MTIAECIWNHLMLVWIMFVKFDARDLFGRRVNEIIFSTLFINQFFVMTVFGEGTLALLVWGISSASFIDPKSIQYFANRIKNCQSTTEANAWLMCDLHNSCSSYEKPSQIAHLKGIVPMIACTFCYYVYETIKGIFFSSFLLTLLFNNYINLKVIKLSII